MKKQTKATIFIFITLALIMVILGYYRNDSLFYIRAVIFLVGGGVYWWIFSRKIHNYAK